MTATTVLADLVSRGVRLVAVDGRLRVGAPARAPTAGGRTTLAPRKAGLVGLLGRPGPARYRPPAPPAERSPVQEAEPPYAAWPADLVVWYRANEGCLPRLPYALSQGARVADPARFHRSLDLDIAIGPSGVRSRTGALAADLECLRQRVEGETPTR